MLASKRVWLVVGERNFGRREYLTGDESIPSGARLLIVHSRLGGDVAPRQGSRRKRVRLHKLPGAVRVVIEWTVPSFPDHYRLPYDSPEIPYSWRPPSRLV